jgi:cell division septation protein DedD
MKEKDREPNTTFQNNESDVLSKIEISETSLIHEELRIPENPKGKMENNPSGDRGMYCTICNKQIEKYGRRKAVSKKPGWVFCPKHGWIQEGVSDRRMEPQKPVELTIEEVLDEHEEEEKHREQEWPEISPKTETSEELSIPEAAQESALLDKEEKTVADLAGKVVRSRSTLIGIIVSLIFLSVAFSMLGYFVWKGSSRELPETKSSHAVAHDEEPAAAQSKLKVPDSSQGSHSQAKFAYEVTGILSSFYQKDLSVERQTTSGEKNLQRPAPPQGPLAAAYTVQVGAFANITHARSLKKELYKKGYPAYISSSNANGQDRLYKVSVGKFSNRKKAESVSDKLTKTQSIHSFVTPFGK